jgi:DNA-binding transcriptional ArsR family regulator
LYIGSYFVTVTFLLPMEGSYAVRERAAASGGRLDHVSASPAGDPFSALGDTHRRLIVEMLGSGGRSVRDIADALPISRPAVSRHLRLLKDAGLVVEEPRGTQRIYRLHDEGVAAVQAYLRHVWGDAAARLKLFAENTPEATEETP